MFKFKVVIVAVFVAYFGIEAITNVQDDIGYFNRSDIRAGMAIDQERYNQEYK